ncbi:MAG: diguanylate cyclase, partial [Proteobacteria bacterium]|nr:diguanylate cyclase [Pseudomonadota bacterium]
MSILALFCLLFALLAVALLVLYVMQRRQRGALEELTRELHRIAVGGSLRGRVELSTDQREVTALVTVVNHLLTRAAAAAEPQSQPASAAAVSELGDHLHEAVLIHGKNGILYANPQFAQLIGAQPAELIGRKLEDLVPPEFAELVADNIRHRLAGESTAPRYEVDLLGLQGQHARLELSAWPVDHAGQRALLIVGVEVLPTQTVAALAAPAGMRSRARVALESLPGAVVTVDAHSRVDYLNPAAAALLGVVGDSAGGVALEELARHASEADRKLLAEPVHQALTAGAPLNLGRRPLVFGAESAERLVEVTAAPLRDEVGDITGAVLLLHDVTESRGLTRQISYQAAHDALTGLVNRREFERRLQEAVDGARRGDANHVLCYLDLDRFKVINDTSGHQAGDSLLRDIAKVVRSGVRDSDTVGRLGGDEFGMLLMGCPLDKARQIADEICRKVADHRFVWRDRIFNVGASIGLVEVSRDAASIEEVLAAADSACYQAKRQGSHVTVYSGRDELLARESGEIQWLQLLQSALKEHRFELYCQPIVAAYGDGDAGPAMEVLVRLRNEAGEQVSPADFLQAAERY